MNSYFLKNRAGPLKRPVPRFMSDLSDRSVSPRLSSRFCLMSLYRVAYNCKMYLEQDHYTWCLYSTLLYNLSALNPFKTRLHMLILRTSQNRNPSPYQWCERTCLTYASLPVSHMAMKAKRCMRVAYQKPSWKIKQAVVHHILIKSN